MMGMEEGAMDNGLTQPQSAEVVTHLRCTPVGHMPFPHCRS
jgi:hypothetical protein